MVNKRQFEVQGETDTPFEIEVEGRTFSLSRVAYPPINRWGGKSFTAAVSMVKNEADIIQAWLSHVCSLFDQVYIVDHSSSDGTYSYLRKAAQSRVDLHIFTFAHPGMFQAEIINRLVEIAAQENPQAWIFPLDADEFLSVKSREGFFAWLREMPQSRILRMKWVNSLPISLRGDEVFTFCTPCLIPSQPGEYAKLALHASTVQGKDWRFAQGNHQLWDSSGNEVGESKQVAFADLFHLPIRSFSHFVLKCIQGYLAYQTLPDERRDDSQSYHRKAMIRQVNQMGFFDPHMIRTFIVGYGRKSYTGERGRTIQRLLQEGWESGFMEVSNVPIGVGMDRELTFMDLAERALEGEEVPFLEEFLKIFKAWRSRTMLHSPT